MEGTSLLGAKHESYLQLWRGRVMECQSSGKSIAVWCKENGINIKTYYFWQKRVWDKETQTLIQSGQNLNEFLNAVDFVVIMVKHNKIKENMDKLADKVVLDYHNICSLPEVYHI